MTSILALDPGKLSGYAWFGEEGGFASGELDFMAIGDLIETYGRRPDVQLVTERFVIGPTTGKRPDANWSLEVIGIARRTALKVGRPLVFQAPANAKSFAVNDRLKAMGWWHVGGKGHANDAARHLMIYRVSTGWWDDRLLLPV